jgi:hypothetical protein
VIIVLGIQMPEYDRYLDFEWKNVLWFKLSLLNLQGFAIAIFSFTCVTNIFVV